MSIKVALMIGGFLMLPVVFSTSPAKATPSQALNCEASGIVANFQSVAGDQGNHIAIINVAGAKHQGELISTSNKLSVGQEVRLCTDAAGKRIVG